MKKRSRKLISILLTLSLLVTLLVPMVGPAAARSINSVSRVISVSDNYNSATAGTDGKGEALTTFTVKEDSDFAGDFEDGDVLELSLKPGVKWNRNGYSYAGEVKVNSNIINPYVTSNNTTVRDSVYVRTVSDTTLNITLPSGSTRTGTVDTIEVALWVDINGSDGDIYLTVVKNNNGFTNNTYNFAVVNTGDTTASAESVEKIGKSGDQGGVIRIDETSAGSITTGVEQTIKLKLSSNFEWQGLTKANVSFGGGLTTPADDEWSVTNGNDQTAYIYFYPKRSGTNSLGTIYIETPIRATSSASYGDVEVSISGSPDIDDADLLVAEYVDWGVEVTIKSVKDLSAGKFEDITTDTIKIEETVANSLVGGRDLTITVPDWVKITDISNWSVSGVSTLASKPEVDDNGAVDGTDSDFDITISKNRTTSTSTGKIEFKLDLSIEADKTGDIEAIIEGAGVPSTSIVIAKAYAPATASVDKVNDVRMGVQAQEIADIYIAETTKEAFKAKHFATKGGAQAYIKVTAPDGVKFTNTPTAEVVEGNLTLKSDAKLTDNDTVFQIPVDSDSSRPSTVKVTNINVTVDRTYPEGDIIFKIGGSSLVENSYDLGDGYLGGAPRGSSSSSTSTDAGQFVTKTAVKVKVANCTTAAPGETKYESVFKIGDTSYTQNGVSRTMDVAPYLSNGRTYMPIRYAAYAAGVSESNIMWSDADQSVTLVKGDRVVRLVIGDTTMLVNGTNFTMDVAPELVNPGRTMLPVRWVAQALGCNVDWDEATQTVTVVTQ